jgi:hypothetical protein
MGVLPELCGDLRSMIEYGVLGRVIQNLLLKGDRIMTCRRVSKYLAQKYE